MMSPKFLFVSLFLCLVVSQSLCLAQEESWHITIDDETGWKLEQTQSPYQTVTKTATESTTENEPNTSEYDEIP